MTRNVLSPHRCSNDIKLRLRNPIDPTNSSLEFTWDEAGSDEELERRLDLRGHPEWRQLSFEVEAELATDRLAEVLPPGSDYRSETSLILSLRCPSTKLRYPIVLDPSPGGVWRGDVKVDRRDVRGRVELCPLLYRRTEYPASGQPIGPFARFRFALLGTGQPLALSVDVIERPSECPVVFRWCDFRASSNEWLRTHSSTMYYLDTCNEPPVLWLNSSHSRLRSLLQGRIDSGVDAGMRGLLSAWLAETVWLQLFHGALSAVTSADTDEQYGLPEGWRGEVLRQYLSIMFPDRDGDLALADVVAMRDSRDQSNALIGMAVTATQEIVGSRDRLNESVRRIEKGS